MDPSEPGSFCFCCWNELSRVASTHVARDLSPFLPSSGYLNTFRLGKEAVECPIIAQQTKTCLPYRSKHLDRAVSRDTTRRPEECAIRGGFVRRSCRYRRECLLRAAFACIALIPRWWRCFVDGYCKLRRRPGVFGPGNKLRLLR